MRGRADHAAHRQRRVPVQLQRLRAARAARSAVHDGGGAGRQAEAHRRAVRPGRGLGRALRAELRGRTAPVARAQERRDAHEDLAHAVRGRVRRRARAAIEFPSFFIIITYLHNIIMDITRDIIIMFSRRIVRLSSRHNLYIS